MLSKEERDKLLDGLRGEAKMLGATDNYWLTEAIKAIEGMGAILDAIEELRVEEGDSVCIICDNPDFHAADPYNTAVDCCGEWTSWDEQRFKGDNLADALAKAVAARRNKKEKPK